MEHAIILHKSCGIEEEDFYFFFLVNQATRDTEASPVLIRMESSGNSFSTKTSRVVECQSGLFKT